jgi:hypothetical protein
VRESKNIKIAKKGMPSIKKLTNKKTLLPDQSQREHWDVVFVFNNL